MNSLFAIIAISTFFISVGWKLTCLAQGAGRIERTGLSFLLGSGLTTFIWFILFRLGLPFNLYTLLLSGSILAGIGFGVSKIVPPTLVLPKKVKLSKLEIYLSVFIGLFLLIAFIIGSYHPLAAWDSLALYDFRGHAIALNHSLKDIVDSSYYVSYPLMISLAHAAVYMLGGINAQGIHAVIFAAFTLVIFGRMREWTNVKYALLTCILVIFQNEIFAHATFAYTNLPYTSFLILGLLYAVTPSLLLSGILIGLSTWTRSSEVFWILGIILLAWQGIRTKKFVPSFIAISIVLAMRYTWSSFLNDVLVQIGQPAAPRINYFTYSALLKIIANLSEIFKYLYYNVAEPYLGVWFLVIPIAMIALIKRNVRLIMLLTTIILSAGMVTVGVMIFSTYYETWNQIGDSARRMMLFVIPLSLVAGIYSLYLIMENPKHAN